jgi:hypothetical protein
MPQTTQAHNPVATLTGMFPGYQPMQSPLQAAYWGIQGVGSSIPQTRFMPPARVRPGQTGFVGSQYPNTLSAENLPLILQSLGRR